MLIPNYYHWLMAGKVIAIAGILGERSEEPYQKGFDRIISISGRTINLKDSITRAGELIQNAAERTFRLI